MVDYVESARRRERSAVHLARRRDWPSALRLQLDAAVLWMRAKLAAAGERRALDELLPGNLLQLLLERLYAEGVSVPRELEQLRPLLSARDWDALDRLSESEAERAAHDLELVTRFLAGTLPALRDSQRLRERRIFSLGMALLGTVALGALAWSLTRPPDLALRRPVSAAPAGWHTSAEEAVNGVRFGELGYHSESARAPWLQVDLGAQHPIRKIKVYGRNDCCPEQSIPLLIEGSSDGRTFVPLGQRDKPFRPFRPWVLNLEAASARYIRARPLGNTPLVIAELEVY